MPDWEINFGFVSNAQGLTNTTREIKAFSDAFSRMIINDVALSATDQAYLEARRTLVASLRKSVMAEVSRMAMTISQQIAQPAKYSGPYRQISIKGGMSATAQRFGFQETFRTQKTGITWAKRNKGYMKWKDRHGYSANWWEMAGTLAEQLADEDLYTEAFGPVNVLFTRAKNQDKIRAGMPRAIDPATVDRAWGAMGEANAGGANVTQVGRRGRYSAEYQVGKLEVIAFGRITPQMLPALGAKTWNPALADPGRNYGGLMSLFPDDEDEDGVGGASLRTKLYRTPRDAKTRYAVEPFVSFFLTRAIPNAVWRRTEQLVERGASNF